jgi:hypothetical protein
MILEDYMQNPLGKGISVMSGTRETFDYIYESLKNDIDIKWYNISDQYLIAHLRIPSKSVKTLKYDVLMEFDLSTIDEGRTTINGSKVRVFSNCPSFTYTYAYAFSKKGDLCPWAVDKYDPAVLLYPAKVRNPYELENYERSIYVAGKYILSNGRNYISRIANIAVRDKTYAYILSPVRTSKQIDTIYKLGREEQHKQSATPKKHEHIPVNKHNKHTNSDEGIKMVDKVKSTSKTKTTGKTSTTKKIGHI